MPRMPSYILVGISLPLWLVLVAAQNFIPLSNYSDYGSLQPCQKVCLNDGVAYNDPKTAQASCGNLINQLNGVDGCVVNSPESQCSANATAAYGAKSIIAAYCTSEIALEGVNIQSTTVLPPTSCEWFMYNSSGTLLTLVHQLRAATRKPPQMRQSRLPAQRVQ